MNNLHASANGLELSPWQKVQAAMLYHYASPDYLKTLHTMVTHLVNGEIEPLLQLAKAEYRDSYLVDSRWGTRDTSDNWANNAWPFFKQLQLSLAQDLAKRTLEQYGITDVNNCFRGAREFSLDWTTPAEEEELEALMRTISNHSIKIDYTCNDHGSSMWDDSAFADYFPEFAKSTSQIPKFRIRTDVTAVTGKLPNKTGVYVSADDPHAAMQFAWTGGSGGKLRASQTFSDIGLAALDTVGRADLWFDERSMLDFAMSEKYKAHFQERMMVSGELAPGLASSTVALASFIERPCKWLLVEAINGEFESIEFCKAAQQDPVPRQHVPGGSVCREAGYYFTPAARESRRYFAFGEVMPDFKSDYGETYWQWDWAQS